MKSSRTKDSTKKYLYFRMVVGGITGAIISILLAWVYVYFTGKNTSINPISIMGSIIVAWFGFVIGTIASLFSKNWQKQKK